MATKLEVIRIAEERIREAISIAARTKVEDVAPFLLNVGENASTLERRIHMRVVRNLALNHIVNCDNHESCNMCIPLFMELSRKAWNYTGPLMASIKDTLAELNLMG